MNSNKFLSLGALLTALWAIVGLLMAQWGILGFMPWDLVFQSFHMAGWYAPFYLLVIAWHSWSNHLGRRRFALLTAGFIPAVMAGLALRILFTNIEGSPLPQWVVGQLGLTGAGLITGSLSLILSALLIVLGLVQGEPEPKPTDSPKSKEHEPRVQNNPIYPEEEVVHRFRQGVAGLLETRLRTPVQYPDLGDDRDDTISPVIITQGSSHYQSELKTEKIEDVPTEVLQKNLEVFFSKEGSISDYPPQRKKNWVTIEDDPVIEPSVDKAPTVPVEASANSIISPADAQRWIPPVQAASMEGDDDEEDEEEDYLDSEPEAYPKDSSTDQIRENPVNIQNKATIVLEDRNAINPEQTSHGHLDQDDDSRVLVSPNPEDEVEPEINQELDAEVDSRLLPPLPDSLPLASKSYMVPIAGLLDAPEGKEYWLIDDATTRSAHVLKMTLQEFGIQAEVTGIRKGPVITMFEILPAPGVKLNRITNLADNIALRLAAQSVRIVAPIPGKHAVGIEIPNRDRAKVSFAELLVADGFSSSKMEIPVALGKDITGDAQIIDLTKTPHLLIAGSTGSGKSVCVNALICSILYRRSPAEVNLILIDPKIVELKFYNDIPHLLTPVITEPKRAFQALQWCLFEMERRYSLLDAMQVRDIKSFNKKIKTRNIATPHLPYLVIVIDEFADLMATSGKELEGTLARLAAMSRAVGIHLVLATQRPSTDVITGLIKANIPSRIAFMVASKIDSRIIIDSMGAEKLLGKGDMLFTSAWDPFPFRLQGAFLSEDEVERVVTHVKTLGKPDYIDDEIFFDAEEDESAEGDDEFNGGEDPLMKEAIDIVVTAKKASASYLQRRLKIGYNRAARLVELMETMGIVGPANGSKPREILRMFQ